ncbi:class I SAM-dependent methyltransferase [Paenibacillus illinoisensis]|uniref:class I SAM-dependent methyltransferase n=1 Tax=Paenibacillus illinoisensis TaxID=59845 RepID=UPI00301BCF5B
MKIPNFLLFLLAFLKNPKRVGSIFPSSAFLARKIVQSVYWNDVRAIAELGAGMGAITRIMEANLPSSAAVLIFERDRRMRNALIREYPHFRFASNASSLIKKMNQEQILQLDCIICGLPFFNFSKTMREHILAQISQALRPGGKLVLYQYSLHMKQTLSEELVIENTQFVTWNFPPVFVYTCRKKENDT